MSGRNLNSTHSLALILAAAVSAWLVLVGIDSAPRLLGRLHPSVVHLPVGVLLLATALAIASRFRRWEFLGESLQTILALGTWSALLAVATGSLLASVAGYDEVILNRHRWLGSLLALFSLLMYLLVATAPRDRVQGRNRLATLLLCGGALLVLATGHAGGALTHGPDYLTGVLPQPIRYLFVNGSETVEVFDFRRRSVYESLIAPALDEQCAECHGQGRSKGGFRVDAFELLLKGGDSGRVVVPGKPGVSELLRRITLSPHDEEHMPPDGRPPLTIAQTEVIRWWIKEGASFEKSLAEADEAEMPSSVRTLFNRLAPPDRSVSAEPEVEVSLPSPEVVEDLRARGVALKYLSEEGARLDVSYAGLKEPLVTEDLEPLTAIAVNVVWLDLSERQLPPGSFEILGELRNLRRLHLEKSDIEDQNLENLIHLQELEYLNLYGTAISDEGVPVLAKLNALKWLYLWQSSVSREGAERLKESLPGVEVNLGS